MIHGSEHGVLIKSDHLEGDTAFLGMFSAVFPVTVNCVLSPVQLFATPLTVAHQAPLSTEFPRQDYWSELTFPPPGDLHPEVEPESPACLALQAGSLRLREALGAQETGSKHCWEEEGMELTGG